VVAAGNRRIEAEPTKEIHPSKETTGREVDRACLLSLGGRHVARRATPLTKEKAR
jgi:hypothetical protein